MIVIKKLRYEVVYDEIRLRIKNGYWKINERIPTIEDISKELNVGVSSVREAIRILEKQGILLIQQGSGTYVGKQLESTPSEQFDFLENASFVQLLEARLVIEPELSSLAALNANDQQKQAILHNAQTMQKKVRQKQDFLKEDIEFHHLIALASGNHILVQMLQLMSDLLLDSRRKTMKWNGMDEKAVSYHVLIAHSIVESQSDQAKILMKNHIEDMLLVAKKSK